MPTADSLPDDAQPRSRVDFGYAFATPHRITVGLPDSSHRTLLDLQPGSLRMTWSYDDLLSYPPASFKTPPTNWGFCVTPQLDGEGFADSSWERLDGWLPALRNTYETPAATLTLEVVGAAEAALLRVRFANRDSAPHRLSLRCDSTAWGESPGWTSPGQETADHVVAGWAERADRVLLLATGADRYSERQDGMAAGPSTLLLVWDLAPGETREGFVVRPYQAYSEDLPALRHVDWPAAFEAGVAVWQDLLGRSCQLEIPDPGARNAWLACLADLFIMREPVAGGYVAAVPGTECYRAPNAFEAAIVAVALDQAGCHRLSAKGYRMCLDMQEPDGNWNDPKGWGHLMWGGAGFKSWAAMEHYRLTGDRGFLERVFPRMLASSRWQDRQRKTTRARRGQPKPLTHGLMPRGMGDCGLMDDDDLYGVFLPHNIWALYADRLAMEAATILGHTEEAAEIRRMHNTARRDLLAAIEAGAIEEGGYRWIPGVPGKTSGSRWGVLNALTPTGLLPPDHELITGTLRKIEGHMSPGGIPVHTGWMADGMWVAITLDNIAAAHLARGDGDAAAEYLYATLNHGTPLYTWCEERGQEAGTEQCSGDRQHLWTPVAVVRCLRDCLVREDGDRLQLGLGMPRKWLASGQPVGIRKAPTHFGPVSCRLRFDSVSCAIVGEVTFPRRSTPREVALHLRLPEGMRVTSATAPGAELLCGQSVLLWRAPRGRARFEATVG